jgi:hypothetical protein
LNASKSQSKILTLGAQVSKARATQMVKKGKLSAAEKKKIDAKANKQLKQKAK